MTHDRTRWHALYVLCGGMLMIVLDATIVNVALPAIQDDLGFSASGLAWVVNGYLITFGGLLLLAGRLGDLLGRRTIFLAGLAVFTAASLLCGLATSQGLLVAARFVQGAGGAMTSAVILGMIFSMFPEPNELAKAIGVFGFVASGGGSVGLLAGGVVTQALDWHWIFLVNLPIGILTALLAVRLVQPDSGLGLHRGADVPGAVLITSALMLLVYTIVVPVAEDGWGAPSTLVLGAIAVALIAAFIVREAHANTPLMPLRIFRSRTLAGANATQMLLPAALFGMFFLGALYLQRVLGYDALQIGLAFLPYTVVQGILSVRYTDRLIARLGARRLIAIGIIPFAAGLALLTRAGTDASYPLDFLPPMLLMGVGGGLSFPPIMTLAMSSATPADAGLVSGLVTTSAQVGGAVGLAVLATISAAHTKTLTSHGAAHAQALTDGYHLAFWIGVGLLAAAMAVTLAILRPTPTAGPDVEPHVNPCTAPEDEKRVTATLTS
jgi:EmrB/QacA subfamily drug resistance transporter